MNNVSPATESQTLPTPEVTPPDQYINFLFFLQALRFHNIRFENLQSVETLIGIRQPPIQMAQGQYGRSDNTGVAGSGTYADNI